MIALLWSTPAALADGVVATGLVWRVQWAGCEAESAEAAADCATAVYSGGSATCMVAGAPGPYPSYPYQWDDGRYSADGQTFFFRIFHHCSGASPTFASATRDSCPAHASGAGGLCICDPGWTAVKSATARQCVRVVDVDNTASPPLACTANPSLGNPVVPSTGSKRQVVDTGVALAGVELRLVFDSTLLLKNRPADASTPGFDLPRFDLQGLGGAWSSTWHRRLVVDPGGHAASLVRGDGSVEVFLRDATGRYRSTAPMPAGALVAAAGTYRYTDLRHGRVDTYDSSGRWVAAQAAQGPSLSLAYSDEHTSADVAPGAGYLIGVTDSTGRAAGLTYAAQGPTGASPVRLSTIVDPSGRTVRLEWSDQGDALIAVVWPDQTRLQFHADDPARPWALTGITDENLSRHASYGYDDRGRAMSTQQGGGISNAYGFDYGADGPRDTLTDHYDAAAGLVLRVRGWTVASPVLVQLPSGASSTMQFVAHHGVVGLSSATQPAGSGCAASAVHVGYDSAGRPNSFIDANGHRTCVAHDARGLELVRTEGLPAAGADCETISATVDLPGGARRTTRSLHPIWALAVRRAEPGRITTDVYNGQPDPFTGALARCAPIGATLPDASPIAVRCRIVEQATTDADGRLGLAAPLQPGVPARERRWTYDDQGRVLTETDALGGVTSYTYHPTTSFTGAGPDASGHTAGDLATVTNAAGHTTRLALYDRLGNWLQLSDANGVPSTRRFDARARLASQTVAGETTHYEYWPSGQLKQLTLPDGGHFRLAYDAAHRLTSIEDPSGNRITYELDGSGRRVAETVSDPAGTLRRTVQRSFDALGRVQQIIGREP